MRVYTFICDKRFLSYFSGQNSLGPLGINPSLDNTYNTNYIIWFNINSFTLEKLKEYNVKYDILFMPSYISSSRSIRIKNISKHLAKLGYITNNDIV